MVSDRFKQVEELFERAWSLSDAERVSFLDRECAGDAGLRDELLSLLRRSDAPLPADPDPPASADASEDLTGRTVGRYRILRKIGSGGMGVVYEARQASPHRRVAVKVLRPSRVGGGATSEDLERLRGRFLEEAEILGRLDHPGVVSIHELDRDEDGRVFFVMRLVEGEDLARIIARLHEDEGEGAWTLHRVLSALVRVCETMASAHEKGVLHRDLKPANVMLGRFGEVTIVDWGLAKVLGATEEPVRPGAPTDAAPVFTLAGDVIGTPSYMPPEQAEGRLELVGPRSDVYAVGAILYHLLAGRAPYTEPEKRLSTHELLERVRLGSPEPVDAVRADVPTELVAVCRKAMARAPEDRYPTMAALGDDLRAFLEHRVVHAYETGAFAELKKWCVRNPWVAITSAVVALSLSGALARIALQQRALARQEREKVAAIAQEKEEADEARAVAQQETARTRAILDFHLNLLSEADAYRSGRDVLVVDVLRRAAEGLEGTYPDDPDIEAEIRSTIGWTFKQLGFLEDAAAQIERALDLRREFLGEAHPKTFVAMTNLSLVYRELARFDDALELMRETLEVKRRVMGEEDPSYLLTLNNLGLALRQRGELADARELLEEVVAIKRRVLPEGDRETQVSINNLALVLQAQGDLERAEALVREVLDQRRARLPPAHPDLINALGLHAPLLFARGEVARALDESEEALEAARQVWGEHWRTVQLLAARSGFLSEDGRPREAEILAREGVELGRRLLPEDHWLRLSVCLNLGRAIALQGRHEEAVALLEPALAAARRVFGPSHPTTVRAAVELAPSLVSLGRAEEAERTLRAAREGGGTGTIGADRRLAEILRQRGALDEALALARAADDRSRSRYGADSPHAHSAAFVLTRVLIDRGDRAEAESRIRAARARSTATLGADHVVTQRWARLSAELDEARSRDP